MLKTKLYKWALMALLTLSPSASFAVTQEAACAAAIVGGGTAIQFSHPSFIGQLPTDGSAFPSPGGEGGGIRVCHYSSAPTLGQTTVCNVATTEVTGTNFASIYDGGTDTACIYSYEVAVAGNARAAPAVIAAATVQSVPIFSPFGLLVLLSGLLMYGKRRKGVSKTN